MNDQSIIPGYWMDETSGVLRPVVEAYIRGEFLNQAQIATMRAYLRQWIIAPGWVGPEVDQLRESLEQITSMEALDRWIQIADEGGIDPL